MAKRDYIVFGQPRISAEEIEEVVRTLKSGWIGTGPKVRAFEEQFAAYVGSKEAVAVSSCTAALHLALVARGIGPGDEVITTAMTFAATVGAIVLAGATPVLVDIERDSLNIDIDAAGRAVTPRTRAIIPVHFAGAPVDMIRLGAMASKRGIAVIQDCAHAIETRWMGRSVGAYPDVACYSFYSTKNVTTIEGGMICTNDEVLARRARIMSNHGMSKDAWKRFSGSGYRHYDIETQGFKYNMTDVEAAIGIHQLREVEAKRERRRKIWERYDRELARTGLGLPPAAAEGGEHAYHLYTVLAGPAACGFTRDGMLSALHERGIGCGVHYRSVAAMTYYKDRFGFDPARYPNAARVGDATLSLPLTPYLADREVSRVIEAVKDVLRGARKPSERAS